MHFILHFNSLLDFVYIRVVYAVVEEPGFKNLLKVLDPCTVSQHVRASAREVLGRRPSGRKPRGRPRTRWRDYVARLAWERLGVPPETQEEGGSEQEDGWILSHGEKCWWQFLKKKSVFLIKFEHFEIFLKKNNIFFGIFWKIFTFVYHLGRNVKNLDENFWKKNQRFILSVSHKIRAFG